MALLKSLKKVLTELGGTPDPKDLTAKTIDKIADNVSGGGGGSSALIVEIVTGDNVTYLNKTAGEIINALPLVYIRSGNADDGYSYFNILSYYAIDIDVYVFEDKDGVAYVAETLDDYPAHDTEPPA